MNNNILLPELEKLQSLKEFVDEYRLTKDFKEFKKFKKILGVFTRPVAFKTFRSRITKIEHDIYSVSKYGDSKIEKQRLYHIACSNLNHYLKKNGLIKIYETY